MNWWWTHYATSVPAVSADEWEEIVDLTGCVPFLLRALLNGWEAGSTYQQVRQCALQSEEFRNVQSWVTSFAKEQKRRLDKGEFIE